MLNSNGDWTIAPYTIPLIAAQHPHAECPCTWIWQPRYGRYVIKYAHSACETHGRAQGVEQHRYQSRPQVQSADKMTWPKYGKGVPRLRMKVYRLWLLVT